MMKKYYLLTLLFAIIVNGCARHNQIDFSSSEAFFSSLNETKKVQKEDIKDTPILHDLKKSIIDKVDKQVTKKPFILTFSSYEKQLKQKIGFDEFTILKIFNHPSLKIKHGKIKNFQFHLKSCHLDLFFLNENDTYKFRHFDIRPSTISSELNKEKCAVELNKRFILIHYPK